MSQIEYSFGWKPSPPDHRDVFYTAPRTLMASLPSKVDLSEGWSDPVWYPVWNQSNLGSCGPHTACADVVFAALRQQKLDSCPMPSRLFVYYATRMLMGTVNYDSGVDNRTLLKALAQYGWCDESMWPYNTARFRQTPPQECFQQAKSRRISQYLAVRQDLAEMKACLAGGDPFIFGFTVYDSIREAESTGVIPYPKRSDKVSGGHDVLVCFTGDTRVSLMDGTEKTMLELVEEYKNKSFWVYSCNKKGEVVPGLAHSPRKTGRKRKIVKVVLDNGESIRCTRDHPFLMRDGQYKNACELTAGDKLMPLYRRLSTVKGMKGYEEYYNPRTEKWYYTHRTCVLKTQGAYCGVVHHKDFNKSNNRPDNLEVMSWEDHTELHARIPIALNRYAKSNEGRQKSRELMNVLWTDPVWREASIKRLGENGSNACKKKAAEGLCGFQAVDKDRHREMCRKNALERGCSQLHTDEATKKRQLTRSRKFSEDEEFRNKVQRTARKNLASYNQGVTDGTIKPNEKQIEARRKNAEKLSQPHIRKKAAIKTAYTRFHKDKYATFEEYLEAKGLSSEYLNHSVVSVEDDGVEDVYDITVDEHHNFALSVGIFVHNCGYDDSTERFKLRNSWSTDWGVGGYGWIDYKYALNPQLAADFWTVRHSALPDINPDPPEPPPQPHPEPSAGKIVLDVDWNAKKVEVRSVI